MSIELTNLICPLMYDKQISSETKGGYIQGENRQNVRSMYQLFSFGWGEGKMSVNYF